MIKSSVRYKTYEHFINPYLNTTFVTQVECCARVLVCNLNLEDGQMQKYAFMNDASHMQCNILGLGFLNVHPLHFLKV